MVVSLHPPKRMLRRRPFGLKCLLRWLILEP